MAQPANCDWATVSTIATPRDLAIRVTRNVSENIAIPSAHHISVANLEFTIYHRGAAQTAPVFTNYVNRIPSILERWRDQTRHHHFCRACDERGLARLRRTRSAH